MESWPPSATEETIDGATVRKNLDGVRSLLSRHALDAIVITSADPYLNEYTPLADNHRFDLSGFTGSTALMIVPGVGRARLFVDGRYHLQADLEVDAEIIRVEKVPLSAGIVGSLLEQLAEFDSVGFEGDRISDSLARGIEARVERTHSFAVGEVSGVLGRESAVHHKRVEYVDASIVGADVADKLARVFEEVECPGETVVLLNALDDIAWLTDGRAYHFPYQSSFAAVGFATADAVHVTLEEGLRPEGPVPAGIEYHTDGPDTLLASSRFDHIREVWFDATQVTAAFARGIAKVRPDWKLVGDSNPVVAVRAVKTPEELAHFEEINRRSSRAIAATIRWVRDLMAQGERITELSYYEQANRFYAEEGARDLSFHTIAAVGANSAIIHFSDPRDDVVAGPDDLMLLDSGAYYEGGYCTDITRSFIAAGARSKPTARQKEIYTLVLKGVLRGMMAVFPAGSRGVFLDSLIRAPIHACGLNYSHGTGHGVGIHVHEPGVSLGPSSTLPIREGQISSIEPGIYLEGWGGVRIENVVVYEKHPEFEGYLRPRALNYIGLDEHLVDFSMLDPHERAGFDAYQERCAQDGTRDLG